MRIGVIGDVHWCANSSIVRGKGKRFSKRLENLISSISSCERKLYNSGCDIIVYLGDFFDRSDLTAEEISALKEVWFSPLVHYILVGNHDMFSSNMDFISTKIFDKENFKIIDTPTHLQESDLYFLPYIKENHRFLMDYFPDIDSNSIVFSHNDIKGLQYGIYCSDIGINLSDIKNTCGLFVNGHLHNAGYKDNLINLGNVTGQNFSENSFEYPHHILILDTVTKRLEYIENDFALNFYHISILKKEDLYIFEHLKPNAVLSITTTPELLDVVKLNLPDYVVESRIVVQSTIEKTQIEQKTISKTDYLKSFKEFVLSSNNSEIVEDELNRILI